MKKVILFALFIITTNLFAQKASFLTYYELSPFMQASPGAFKFGLYGFDNPAMTSYIHNGDIQFSILTKEIKGQTPWALFTGNPYGSFGLIRSGDSAGVVVDYRYGFSFGNPKFSGGFAYGFVGGDKSRFGRSNTLHFGLLSRPFEYFSLGGFLTYSLEKEDYEGVVDVAIRPFGNTYPLSIFADASLLKKQRIGDAQWSGGISWEIVDGIRLNGRYFSTKTASIGVDISFGNYGIGAISAINNDNKVDYTTATIRVGALDRTIMDFIEPPTPKLYYEMDLSGEIKYQRGLFFDNSLSLLRILKRIKSLSESKTIQGIVINATNIQTNKTMLWEIRNELKKFKENGKKVIIYIDRAGLDLYHFASIADKIIMDPLGDLGFEGYLLGRSFYKKMFENAHIGFEEIRLFKYKSAAENFAREKMSDADREQRQALIEDWYEIAKGDITKSRNISPETFEKLVNENLMVSFEKAKQINLVDYSGRWADREKIMDTIEKKSKLLDFAIYLDEPQPFDDQWGYEPKKIAVIYALGDCSMDAGIKARQLVNDIKRAFEDNSIKAIVLRVDSPGGDALASDYIAEVIRQNRGKKPIIVSQGAVAASGGYWLSMYADTIVATPGTITGSIGVIASWIYDKGLKDTIGISTDFVKIGKFADLGYPYQMPIIGIGLPIRNLTQEERKLFESYILDAYEEFKKKVAEGRRTTVDKIEPYAQGRVWSGIDGKQNGLVDVLGGLNDAIDIARIKAGIKENESFKIVEMPRPTFNISLNLLNFLGFENTEIARNIAKLFVNENIKANYWLESLKIRVENNGKPMYIIPSEYYDYVVFE